MIHVCNDMALPYHLSFKASQFGDIREPSELVGPEVQASWSVYGHGDGLAGVRTGGGRWQVLGR
jgi:hypothetical protein